MFTQGGHIEDPFLAPQPEKESARTQAFILILMGWSGIYCFRDILPLCAIMVHQMLKCSGDCTAV